MDGIEPLTSSWNRKALMAGVAPPLTPGTPGTCTWTWDGTYWTSQDDCDGAGHCTDVAPDPAKAGGFIDSDGNPLISTFLTQKISAVTGKAGKTIVSIPDDIFQAAAARRKRTVPAVTQKTVASPPQSVTLPCVS